MQNVPEGSRKFQKVPECMQKVPECMKKACRKFQNACRAYMKFYEFTCSSMSLHAVT